jgi:hypothetical protein
MNRNAIACTPRPAAFQPRLTTSNRASAPWRHPLLLAHRAPSAACSSAVDASAPTRCWERRVRRRRVPLVSAPPPSPRVCAWCPPPPSYPYCAAQSWCSAGVEVELHFRQSCSFSCTSRWTTAFQLLKQRSSGDRVVHRARVPHPLPDTPRPNCLLTPWVCFRGGGANPCGFTVHSFSKACS